MMPLQMVVPHFIVLGVVVLLAALGGREKGKAGLVGVFGIVWLWLLVTIPALLMGPPVTVQSIAALAFVLAFALGIAYLPMSHVVESRSFGRLLGRGLMGAVASVLLTFLIAYPVATFVAGDYL